MFNQEFYLVKSIVMKSAFAVLFMTMSLGSHADPHYVQALHPYWGNDNSFIRYLKAFDEPVNVEVLKYDGKNDPDSGEDLFIYIYILTIQGSEYFSLDIACPDIPTYSISGIGRLPPQSRVADISGVASDPVTKNPKADITESNKIIWKLNSAAGRQGMWFYSPSPPGRREYEIKVKSSLEKGQISGPSCKLGSSFVTLDGSAKDPRERIQPVKPEPLKPSEYEKFVEGVARKNGCVEILGMHVNDKDSGEKMYEVSCATKNLLFECDFSERAACYLM